MLAQRRLLYLPGASITQPNVLQAKLAFLRNLSQ